MTDDAERLLAEATPLPCCPRHPGTCNLFAAAGFCAHSQEWDRIVWRNQRWLDRTRFGEPKDATADRAWLVECIREIATFLPLTTYTLADTLRPMNTETKLQCKCGAIFSQKRGLTNHLKNNPSHK